MVQSTVAESPVPTARPDRRVRLRIKRQDGPDRPSRWEEFDVPVQRGANVISCLQWVAANPKTVDGQTTTPVAWDANCLEEVCGACTMLVNGKVRQSCSALIDDYAPNDGDVITLEPMSKFPVVRDLCVDRSRMFRNLIDIKGWVPIDTTYDRGPGPKETPAKQEIRYAHSQCMTCGCCVEACPQYLKDNNFIGPASIALVRYFNEHPIGAELKPARLDFLAGPGGYDDCGNAQNCVKVCPKGIPITDGIGAVGRQMTLHALKRFFVGP